MKNLEKRLEELFLKTKDDAIMQTEKVIKENGSFSEGVMAFTFASQYTTKAIGEYHNWLLENYDVSPKK